LALGSSRLTEHPELLLELLGALPKNVVLIDDNDFERCRRCDGGEHSSEEIRSGVVCFDN